MKILEIKKNEPLEISFDGLPSGPDAAGERKNKCGGRLIEII